MSLKVRHSLYFIFYIKLLFDLLLLLDLEEEEEDSQQESDREEDDRDSRSTLSKFLRSNRVPPEQLPANATAKQVIGAWAARLKGK